MNETSVGRGESKRKMNNLYELNIYQIKFVLNFLSDLRLDFCLHSYNNSIRIIFHVLICSSFIELCDIFIHGFIVLYLKKSWICAGPKLINPFEHVSP